MSYELFQQGPEVYLPILLLSLVVTVLAYGAFPFIFARTRNKVITKKKYRTLCYCINIAVMVFFIALNGEPSSGGPYLLWTWIFTSAGLKTLEKRQVLEGTQPVSKPAPVITQPTVTPQSTPTSNAPQVRFCRKCGAKLLERSKFCPKCGTEVVEVNGR